VKSALRLVKDVKVWRLDPTIVAGGRLYCSSSASSEGYQELPCHKKINNKEVTEAITKIGQQELRHGDAVRP
jgi:hypothetical protein